jgi:hypothetical protein
MRDCRIPVKGQVGSFARFKREERRRITMRILSPVGHQRQAAVAVKDELTLRLPTLMGRVIGIIDNGAGKAYFRRIEQLLHQRIKPSEIIRTVKPHLNRPSPEELLDRMAEQCAAVIVGVGI